MKRNIGFAMIAIACFILLKEQLQASYLPEASIKNPIVSRVYV
jgi:hypothetical protein